jgi:RAB protein geranylgeranyltransferase component A
MWPSSANLFKMKQVKKVGKVARAVCIMSHPIPDTNDSHSVQVILPQKQLGHKSDMYVCLILYSFFMMKTMKQPVHIFQV